MMRDPIPDPPRCPICDGTLERNHHLPEQLGPYECVACRVFCDGSTSEWVAMSTHRARWQQLRKDAADGT